MSSCKESSMRVLACILLDSLHINTAQISCYPAIDLTHLKNTVKDLHHSNQYICHL